MNGAEEKSGAGEGAHLSPQDLFHSLSFSPLAHSLFLALTVLRSPSVADVEYIPLHSRSPFHLLYCVSLILFFKLS